MVTLRAAVCRARPPAKPTRPERAPFDRPSSACGTFTLRDTILTIRPKPRADHAVDREPHHLDRAQHHVVERRDPIVARPVAEIAGQRPLRIVHQDIRRGTGADRGRAAVRRGDVGGNG